MRKEYARMRRRTFMTPIWLAALVAVVGALLWGAFMWSMTHVPTTTVLVTRHAEKQVEAGDDPPLSPAGQARAERLAKALGSAPLEAIFVSQYRRTQQTAAPVAAATGLQPQVVQADDLDALVAAIAAHRGGRVLVVGHSNTVPALVTELSGRPVTALGEAAYGDLFVVTKPVIGTPTVTQLKLE